MEIENFNRHLLLYQQLTNSFIETPSHFKDNFYKCYKSDMTLVTGVYLEILAKFENISLNDIYLPEQSANLPYSVEPYSNMKLFINDGDYYCIYVELGLLIFYFLVYQYQETIKQFLTILDEMSNNRYAPVKLIDNVVYEIDFNYLKSNEPVFFALENFDRVFEMFAKSNNSIIYLNSSYKLIIEKYRIDNMLEYITRLNFDQF